MSTSIAPCRPWNETPRLLRSLGPAAWLVPGLALLLLGAWLRLIVPEWSANPDLSHGFFAPVLFAVLVHESRRRGPLRWVPVSGLWICTCLLALGLSCLLLLVSSLYAAAIDWSHTLVLFLLGIAFSGGLGALLLAAATPEARLVPFNWVAFVALLLWGLCLPLPPGTYNQLTFTLQLWVSERVLGALHLLGIPAIQNGNIIELANTSVGVEEACSGVRSLLSCTFAGFFFSAAFVRRSISRVLLIGLAPLLAIGMNFLRSLLLTLLANRGVDISGFWHDATGFAILGVTALLLGLLALLLEKMEDLPAAEAPVAPSPAEPPPRSLRRILPLYYAGYGSAVACVAFFALLTRPAAPSDQPVPDVHSFMPADPAGWHVGTSNDLYRFADILETEHLGQRIYLKQDDTGEFVQVTLYIAYWSPGQAAVSTVATHTPDACWPGAGWTPQPVTETTTRLQLPDRELHLAEYRLFNNQRIPQHVWFWHSYDRRVIREFDPRRPLEVVANVIEHGVRSDGEQMFVRLSSNRPWEEIRDEPLLQEIFDRLRPYGI